MRFFSTAVLALPALGVVQAQQQQKGIFEKAQDWALDFAGIFQKALNAPKDAAIAKIAENNVYPLTWHNWRNVIKHSGEIKPYDPPEAIMVAVTGGNKTCQGFCHQFDKAWNESVALFQRDPSAPKLAVLNCDNEELLCGMFGAHLGSIMMFLRPQPNLEGEKTPLTVHYQNLTTVTNTEITRIHTRKEYMYVDRYEGFLHPFDSPLSQYGLNVPLAYVLIITSKIPSWAMLMGVSLFSRTFLNKRNAQETRARAAARQAAPAGGAAAPKKNN